MSVAVTVFFQFTTSLLKKTHLSHHHRDLSTTHRTARVQLRYSQSAAFTKTCVSTRHQREPLAWCHQTHLAEFLLGWRICRCRIRGWWRCRCRCWNLSFLRLVVTAAAIFCWTQCLTRLQYLTPIPTRHLHLSRCVELWPGSRLLRFQPQAQAPLLLRATLSTPALFTLVFSAPPRISSMSWEWRLYLHTAYDGCQSDLLPNVGPTKQSYTWQLLASPDVTMCCFLQFLRW